MLAAGNYVCEVCSDSTIAGSDQGDRPTNITGARRGVAKGVFVGVDQLCLVQVRVLATQLLGMLHRKDQRLTVNDIQTFLRQSRFDRWAALLRSECSVQVV